MSLIPIKVKNSENLDQAHAPASSSRAQSELNRDFIRTDARQAAGNFAVQRLLRGGMIQAKLTVGSPGDIHEQQADRVAEQVMTHGETPSIQRKCTTCSEGVRCSDCAEEERVQAKPESGHGPVSPGLGATLGELRGGGQLLPLSLRSFFEPRFGKDFSQVQVHTDNKAAQSARAIHARAFTAGNEIFFGRGEYAPETTTGRKLIAHELAHVVQQTDSGVRIQRNTLPGAPGAGEDIELELMIDQVRDRLMNAPPGEGEPLIANLRQLQSLRPSPPVTTSPLTPWGGGLSTPSQPQSRSCASCHPSTAQPRTSPFGFPSGGIDLSPWPVPRPRMERRNMAMEQGLTVEKWDERIEYQYRRRGDERRARYIRDCRENGAVVCAWLMPVSDAWRLFNLVRAEARRRQYERTIAQMRGEFLNLSDRLSPVQSRTSPLDSFTLSPAAGFSPVAPSMSPVPAQLRPNPVPRPVPIPVPEPSPGPSPSPIPGEAALVAILAHMMLLAFMELVEFGRFQVLLEQLGYTILEDPLGLCIGGCHLPQVDPGPWPDPIPGPVPWPRPRPKPKPDPQPRPVPTLWLPPGKYRHAPLYAAIISQRMLGADPAYDRPDTSQAEEWRRRMDPERGGIMVGSMFALGVRRVGEAMGCDPEQDRFCREMVKRRVLLPDWNRAGGPHLMDTDHVIELQVGALLPFELLDSMSNYELLDFSVNRSIGPQLRNNILYERGRLTALDPTIPWFDIVLVFEELVPLGTSYAEFWSSYEVELGAHIEVFYM